MKEFEKTISRKPLINWLIDNWISIFGWFLVLITLKLSSTYSDRLFFPISFALSILYILIVYSVPFDKSKDIKRGSISILRLLFTVIAFQIREYLVPTGNITELIIFVSIVVLADFAYPYFGKHSEKIIIQFVRGLLSPLLLVIGVPLLLIEIVLLFNIDSFFTPYFFLSLTTPLLYALSFYKSFRKEFPNTYSYLVGFAITSVILLIMQFLLNIDVFGWLINMIFY